MTTSAAQLLERVRTNAEGCTACPLYGPATQTVFGSGDPAAVLMLVGEQPGDHEDVQGVPFVGPAGGVLSEALERAGIDRSAVYVTNAVKHFKFEQRGKRRIHQKPTVGEIRACHPWLEREIELVEPSVVVAMGATAARSVVGKQLRISETRGELVELSAEYRLLVTIHPSAVLRERQPGRRDEMLAGLVDDLCIAYAACPPSA